MRRRTRSDASTRPQSRAEPHRPAPVDVADGSPPSLALLAVLAVAPLAALLAATYPTVAAVALAAVAGAVAQRRYDRRTRAVDDAAVDAVASRRASGD